MPIPSVNVVAFRVCATMKQGKVEVRCQIGRRYQIREAAERMCELARTMYPDIYKDVTIVECRKQDRAKIY